MSSTFLAEPLILIAFIVQRPARHKSGLANVPKGLPGSFMRATTANDVSEPSRPRRRPNERSASDASFEDDVPNYRLISQSRVTDAVQLTNTQSPKEWRKQLLIEIESKSSILNPPPPSSPPSSTFLHPPPSSYVLLRPPSSSSIGLRLPLEPEPYTSRIRPRSLGRCDSRSENKILRRHFLLHMGRLAFSTCALTIMATETVQPAR